MGGFYLVVESNWAGSATKGRGYPFCSLLFNTYFPASGRGEESKAGAGTGARAEKQDRVIVI